MALRGPCMLWEGATQSKGYGSVTNHKGSSVLIHRKVWEESRGPIPDGMTIDHLCRQKTCINPDHMEVVTRAENSRRALAAQTHCKSGHPLSGENVRLHTRANGLTYRVCRACRRAENLRFRERQKAERLRVRLGVLTAVNA